MAKSKDKIANDLYGYDFDELSGAQKASVTRKYNEQGTKRVETTPARRAVRSTPSGHIKVKIGKMMYNGEKTCYLTPTSTVDDLVKQSGLPIDRNKEGVKLDSTGETVKYTDVLIDGETYVIAPGLNSA